MTPVGRVQPRRVQRTFWVDPAAWSLAQHVAYGRGETVSDVLRRAVDAYPEEARWR